MANHTSILAYPLFRINSRGDKSVVTCLGFKGEDGMTFYVNKLFDLGFQEITLLWSKSFLHTGKAY